MNDKSMQDAEHTRAGFLAAVDKLIAYLKAKRK